MRHILAAALLAGASAASTPLLGSTACPHASGATKQGVSGCDFKQVVTTSKEDCEAACCADAGCVTWNWDSNLTRAQVCAHTLPGPHPTTPPRNPPR